MKTARSIPSLINVLGDAEDAAFEARKATFFVCVSCRTPQWGKEPPASCRHCHNAVAFVPVGDVAPRASTLACCE
jgi:hypothetical protein